MTVAELIVYLLELNQEAEALILSVENVQYDHDGSVQYNEQYIAKCVTIDGEKVAIIGERNPFHLHTDVSPTWHRYPDGG